MKKKLVDILPLMLVAVIGLAFVVFFYGTILKSPNDIIFGNGGDGIKNYYTYAYHIKNDSTYTNVEGMNYPYGENYLYTDCHPILANTIKFLSAGMPYLKSSSIGLLNFLMIASIFFTFIIVYLLLVELKLNKWISVFFSISITLLAPQLFRIDAHLALSYSLAIPLSWLLTLKGIHKPRKRYIVFLFLVNLFWMLIHAYLGVIVISFVFSILLLQILSDKQRKSGIFNYIWMVVAMILPVILFYLYTMLVDTHLGRTDNPSGFFLYNAEFDDVLIPSEKPFRPWLDRLTGGIIKLEPEARGYVGLPNALLFIVLVITGLLSIFNAKAKDFLRIIFNNRLLNISLVAAVIALLFALGMPFKQFPSLLEWLPILKQFRATGRFVWPFYFAFSIFSAFVFQSKFVLGKKGKMRKSLGVVFLIVVFGVSYVEGVQYHLGMANKITRYPNLFNKNMLSDEFQKAIDQISPNDYQAILSFPFYYQGSESYGRPRNDEAVRNSLVLSYHTGLPNICANLTRTSIEESKRIVQIVTPNYYPKKIIGDLVSKKPFLIIKSGKHFTQYEQAILDKGISLFKTDKFELLRIEMDALFSDDRSQVVKDFQEKWRSLVRQESFYVTDSSSFFYYDGFESMKSDTMFRGRGSFRSGKQGKNNFATFSPNTFRKDKEYDLSLWMYNGEHDALNLWFRLIVEEYDEANDTWYSTTFFPDQAEVIDGDWSLVEGKFVVQNPASRVYIVSIGKDNSKAFLHADDLLVKESGVDVYRIDSTASSLFFNNHRIDLK